MLASRLRGLAFGASVALCLPASPAGAAGGGQPDRVVTAPPRADFTIVAPAAGDDVVQARILSWFQGQTTVAHARRSDALDSAAVHAAAAEPGIRSWIVLTDPAVAHVFFTVEEPDHTRRYLVSDVPLAGGLDEVGVEQLAQIVYLSALALWAGNVESTRQQVEEGLRRREADARPAAAPIVPAPRAPAPPPPRAAGAGVRVETGAAFTLRAQGDEGATSAVGTSVGVLWHRPRAEMGVRLRADAFLPHERSVVPGVKLELGGVAFGLGLALARRAARQVWMTGEVGPGLDFVRHHAGPIDVSALAPSSGGVNARPNVAVRLGARLDLGAASLIADAFVAVQLLRTHYDILQGGVRAEVLVPAIVQPGFTAGLAW
jgi:hypothetical protein